MKIKELDIVVLNKDIKKYALVKGDVGTIVHVYEKGKAFEVEFIETSGYTVAVLTLKSSDIRTVGKSESIISHAREVASA